ncbi:hypothetical protein PS1_019710 [Malus domestica]
MIQKFGPDNIPLICGGDFNEFLWDHKKSGGAELRYNRPRHLDEFMCKLEEADCIKIVKRAWANPHKGNTLEQWNLKMNDYRSRLIRWSIDRFKQ